MNTIENCPVHIPIDTDTKVLVVGAGPAGLYTAIVAKLLTGKEITIVDKNTHYMRSDIRLHINSSCFSGMPDDAKLKEIVGKWSNRSVPIKEMEESLTKRAHELGIKIIRGFDADPARLKEQFPSAKVIVGADGARSKMREHFFGNEFRFHSNLQYMAQVQYVVRENKEHTDSALTWSFPSGAKIRDFSEQYIMQKFAGYFISQTIKPQEDGSSKVVLQIFIDKETYEQMTDATFKNPYYFEESLHKVPESLRNVLIKWWGARKELHHEDIQEDSDGEGEKKQNKITVAALNTYAAKEFVKEDEQGNIIALVGDASSGFPFRRGMQNGFRFGTKLAQCIASRFAEDNKVENAKGEGTKPAITHFRPYSKFAAYRVFIERIRATVYNWFIKIAQFWFTVSDQFKWLPVKLKKAQRLRIYDRGVTIWNQLAGPQLQSNKTN